MIASSSGPADDELGLLDGHPVRVGRRHRELRALEAHEDPRQHRAATRRGRPRARHGSRCRAATRTRSRAAGRRSTAVAGSPRRRTRSSAPSTSPTRSTRRRPRDGARSSTSAAGSRRTTSPRSFAGMTIAPSPSTVAGTVVRSESSMSVASSSSSPSLRAQQDAAEHLHGAAGRGGTGDEGQAAREVVALDDDADPRAHGDVGFHHFSFKPFVVVHRECGRRGRRNRNAVPHAGSRGGSREGSCPPVPLPRASAARRWVPSSSTVLDPRGEVLHEVVHSPVLLDHPRDLRVRVEDGRVVAAAELLADLRERRVGELAGEVHRHLPRVGDRLGAPLAARAPAP